MRDFQKQRVYNWEDKVIAPNDKSKIGFDNVQNIINFVWENEGLQHPPKATPMPKQNRNREATATRIELQIKETVATWVILHELAHSMTTDIDGYSNMHCEDFVGVYMKLVEKYLNVNLQYLMFTATQANVKFNINAIPYNK